MKQGSCARGVKLASFTQRVVEKGARDARQVVRKGLTVWGDQEWAKKRPYLGNRRGSNGKGKDKPRRGADWRQGGCQEQPSREQGQGEEGPSKGKGDKRLVAGANKEPGWRGASDEWHSESLLC